MFLKNKTKILVLLLVLSFPASSFASGMPSFVELAKKCGPAVVNIQTESTVEVNNNIQQFFSGPQFRGQNPFEEFFKQFERRGAPKQKRKQGSLGSGFIISSDGYIVTNNHVVASADKITVKLREDGKEYKAKLIGTDKETDLALLKIETKKSLPYLKFADSQKAEVGEWVLAIGNPFGLGHSVTKGIISAKGRIIGAGPFDNFIQTDASINPGNSGGPLIDMKGNVVGINTAIIASGQGIGFAIPSNMASNIITQLKQNKKVSRGWLGVTIQDTDENTAKALGLESKTGALVNAVTPGDPADKGGIKVGDVILQINGEKIDNTNDLLRTIANLPPTTTINVKVWRRGKTKSLKVTLGERNNQRLAEAGQNFSPDKADNSSINDLGIVVRSVNRKSEADSLQLDKPHGLIILEVKDNSPAQEYGLAVGDVILEANQNPVNTSAQLTKILKTDGKKRGLIMLLIKRQGRNLFRTIELN